MYQLQPQRGPEWRDLAPGIRGQFRFGPTEALAAARRAVRAVIAEGGDDRDVYCAFVMGAAAWGLTAWEGIGAEGSDDPAPVTPDTVAALLSQRPDIFDRVEADYVMPLLDLLSEKNASGASPNGISAAAPDTAPPAPQSARNAPTPSRRRRATPEIGSGPSSKPAPDSSASG